MHVMPTCSAMGTFRMQTSDSHQQMLVVVAAVAVRWVVIAVEDVTSMSEPVDPRAEVVEQRDAPDGMP